MSDTPMTDAEIESYAPPTRFVETVNADFARQLERELNKWHRISGERIAALERERGALKEDVAHLAKQYVDCTAERNYQVDKLRAEVERLTRERDTALQHLGQQSRDAGLLEAEVERLKTLLRECETTLAMWSDVAPAVSLRADIRAALDGEQK